MSELELLQKVVNVLGNINIPCALTEEISIPVTQCRNSLIDLIRDKVKKQKEAEQNNDIQISEVEPISDPVELHEVDQE